MIDLTQILKLNEKKFTAIMLFFLQMVILKSLKVLSFRCDTNIEINLIKLLYNNAFFFADGHADNSNGGKSYFENKI